MTVPGARQGMSQARACDDGARVYVVLAFAMHPFVLGTIGLAHGMTASFT
jgi:hypothetical protein